MQEGSSISEHRKGLAGLRMARRGASVEASSGDGSPSGSGGVRYLSGAALTASCNNWNATVGWRVGGSEEIAMAEFKTSLLFTTSRLRRGYYETTTSTEVSLLSQSYE